MALVDFVARYGYNTNHRATANIMNQFVYLLKGGDLRSIGQSNNVVSVIDNQQRFDELFQTLFHSDRKVVMRTADALEKITVNQPEYLQKHKNEILKLCHTAKNIELKWHVALLVTRVPLTKEEHGTIWQVLTRWATDRKESRIVRVNALQGLFDLLTRHQELKPEFNLTISKIENENIPSINARIRKLKKATEVYP